MTDLIVYDQETEAWAVWFRSGSGRVMLCQSGWEARAVLDQKITEVYAPAVYFPSALTIAFD